jgi:GTP-binding protein
VNRTERCRSEQSVKIPQAKFVLSAVRAADLVADGRPQFAFVGRSNVGKSSLLNRLLRRRSLARTSSSPGKTRAVNYYLVDETFYLVDLPGYGYAKAGKGERRAWAELMDKYFGSTHPKPQLFQLVDSKVGATVLDMEAVEYFRGRGDSPIVVATKIDRVPRSRRTKMIEQIREALSLPDITQVTPFSARTGEGVKELWREIHGQLRVAAELAN